MLSKLAIVGGLGKMGKLAVEAAEELSLFESTQCFDKGDEIKTDAEIAIEFSVADASFENVIKLVEEGVKKVLVGTSGWSESLIEKLRKTLGEINPNAQVLIVPNFSLSAILQEKWAKEACQLFEDCAIIETHHKQKLDKPSGTALRLSDEINRITQNRPEISSIRSSGFTAKQEVIFANFGERLIIEQDITDRKAFKPGIKLALKQLISENESGVKVGIAL